MLDENAFFVAKRSFVAKKGDDHKKRQKNSVATSDEATKTKGPRLISTLTGPAVQGQWPHVMQGTKHTKGHKGCRNQTCFSA